MNQLGGTNSVRDRASSKLNLSRKARISDGHSEISWGIYWLNVSRVRALVTFEEDFKETSLCGLWATADWEHGIVINLEAVSTQSEDTGVQLVATGILGLIDKVSTDSVRDIGRKG